VSVATVDRSELFKKLSQILRRQSKYVRIFRDEPGALYVESKTTTFRGKPFWVGAIEIKKNYVSFHFIPIVNPKLRATMSPALQKRMQGKACFNFTVYDAELAGELQRVVETGLKALEPGELKLTGYSC